MSEYKQIPQFQAVALMEALLDKEHPFHNKARSLYNDMAEEVRLERIKHGQEMMQEQMQYISEDEWSRIVD